MSNPEQTTTPRALLFCLLNWLIPGAGFIAVKDMRRGMPLFLLINGVFIAGLFFDGYVLLPSVNFASPLDNVVALLTFVVQVWHASGTALVLAAPKLGGIAEAIFARDPGAAFSDLGLFHFLVAGGLNYFATVTLFDILTGQTSSHQVAESPAGENTREKEASI